jgi:nucleotide-binding universal stress UspA family protein
MFTRQVVLVAIDHATDMKRIMSVALSAARAREADVDVIQVMPHRPVRIDDRTGPRTFEPHTDRGAEIRSRLASIPRTDGDDGVSVRSVTLRGEPERVIPAYAQVRQATMLVLQRDFGSSRFWRHGRVVDDVARQSAIPLLVVPTRKRPERDEPGLRRIVTAVDSSLAAGVGLRTAVNLARRHGARVTLVHALSDAPQHMVLSGSEAWELVRRLPAQAAAVAERLRRRAALFGAHDVDTEVATGVADAAILDVAARHDADLVVMGIAHRSWLDRLLYGSILRRVLRRATVPVLVVPVVAGTHNWPDEPVFEQISGGRRTDSAAMRAVA